MTYCCDDIDTGFHFLRVSTFSDAACGNGGSSKSGVQMKEYPIWTPNLDDPPFPHAASERVETRGK